MQLAAVILGVSVFVILVILLSVGINIGIIWLAWNLLAANAFDVTPLTGLQLVSAGVILTIVLMVLKGVFSSSRTS